ncbi:MAG: hypothetical protein IJZ24_06590 [Clostridia bacterium]|nr:hypothetical protein [Clostridia bacterium]
MNIAQNFFQKALTTRVGYAKMEWNNEEKSFLLFLARLLKRWCEDALHLCRSVQKGEACLRCA